MRFLIPTTTEPSNIMVSWLAAAARKTDVEARLIRIGERDNAPGTAALKAAVKVDTVVRAGDRVREVIVEVQQYQPDFIAMSTRGLRGLVASARSSLATALVSEASVPLVLFGPKCESTTSIERLVMPLDGSAYAARAVDAVANAARNLDVGVTLIEVLHSHGAPASQADWRAARDVLESSYLAHVGRVLGGIGTDWDVAHGDPRQTIGDFAAARPGSLIVMTSHGHAGLRRKVIGSVTEAVVATARVPVVVVPPRWTPTAPGPD